MWLSLLTTHLSKVGSGGNLSSASVAMVTVEPAQHHHPPLSTYQRTEVFQTPIAQKENGGCVCVWFTCLFSLLAMLQDPDSGEGKPWPSLIPRIFLEPLIPFISA